MNHWQLIKAYKGLKIRVYDERIVRITGAATPGDAWCESVDGLGVIGHVSTIFLHPDNVIQDNYSIGYREEVK